jgi:hypothetical protein
VKVVSWVGRWKGAVLASCRCSAVSSDLYYATKDSLLLCTEKSYKVARCTSYRRRGMTERETIVDKITK